MKLEVLMYLISIQGFLKGLAVKTENEREREDLISYAQGVVGCIEDIKQNMPDD